MLPMKQDQLKHLIQNHIDQDGLHETGIEGVKLFRATAAVPCVPAVYEPSVIAIVSGQKEALLDGARYVYDNSRYLLCPMSMPVRAGTPDASPQNPLYGVYISLTPRVMGDIALMMDASGGVPASPNRVPETQAIRLAAWDEAFSQALYRLLKLCESEVDSAVLAEARLRELYYAILQGQAGRFARQAFGAGNAIARAITYVSTNLEAPISIDDLAMRAGMSRAVFHRKFKDATTMTPIQFVKVMRLNNAAMKIADGMSVSEAAMGVGYVSPSQFSREFKRTYGQSPRQRNEAHYPQIGAV